MMDHQTRRNIKKLNAQQCCLVIVDIQGKLAQLMCDKDRLFKNVQILIKSCKILDIPVIFCQQCPESLGPTTPEIAPLLEGIEPINKSCFSCCGRAEFNDSLKKTERQHVLLCGIETHVCIYQTAVDLLNEGLDVELIADAVSSRTLENKNFAITKMQNLGVNITSTEMLLFELLGSADHLHFKQIAKLVK